jgi:hypothetical protein
MSSLEEALEKEAAAAKAAEEADEEEGEGGSSGDGAEVTPEEASNPKRTVQAAEELRVEAAAVPIDAGSSAAAGAARASTVSAPGPPPPPLELRPLGPGVRRLFASRLWASSQVWELGTRIIAGLSCRI